MPRTEIPDVLYHPGAPICLTASSAALASGSSDAPLDIGALSHPFRNPFVIDEVRFTIWNPVSANLGITCNFGGSIRLKFLLGDKVVTDLRLPPTYVPAAPQQHVPAWLFGPHMQMGPEMQVGVTGIDVGGQFRGYSHFRWPMPKPLLVPPGWALVGQVARSADGLGGTIVTEVTYAGRALPLSTKLPKTIPVPYVSGWVMNEGDAADRTSAVNLFNQFTKPLHCQRLVGRIQARNMAGHLINDFFDNNALFTTDATIRLRESATSRYLTSRPMPWYTAFDSGRRVWPMGGLQIPPKQWLWAEVASNVAQNTPMVSLVGWREEDI